MVYIIVLAFAEPLKAFLYEVMVMALDRVIHPNFSSQFTCDGYTVVVVVATTEQLCFLGSLMVSRALLLNESLENNYM